MDDLTNENDDLMDGGEAVSGDSPGAGAAVGEEIEKLRDELEQSRERALRAHADLENYRKRARRDADEQLKFANLGLLAELLPVLDNMERAVAAAEKTGDAPEVVSGLTMVRNQLEGVLAKFQCQRIEARHKAFDPNLHAAIMQRPSAEHPPNTVLEVMQHGYQLHDRVIRPAQVVVSTDSPGA